MKKKDIGFIGLAILSLLAVGSFSSIYAGGSITGFLESMWIAVTTSYGLSELIPAITILVFTGMAALIPFSCNIWNCGGEGQLRIGAIAAGFTALTTGNIILSLLAAALGGMIWAGMAGILKSKYNVNEIVTTLFLNLISIQAMSYVCEYPLNDPAIVTNISYAMPFSIPNIPLVGLILGVGIVGYFLMEKTTFGFDSKLAGRSPEVGKYSRLPIKRITLIAMLLGGIFAGLGGGFLIFTIVNRLQLGISGFYGYTGIVVSVMISNKALFIPLSALFAAYVLVTSKVMHVHVGVPFSIVGVIFAVLFFIIIFLRR